MTHDGGVWVLRGENPALDVIAPISIGNNVFIGLNAIILLGVTIGNDVVVAAGSVVTRDIPDGTVVAGVPAKVLRTIGEYRSTSIERGLETKAMPPSEKRKFLVSHFPASDPPRD